MHSHLGLDIDTPLDRNKHRWIPSSTMGVRGASTFPLRNRLPYPVLWSKDLVLVRVRLADIPFPYGINILVATLIPFFAVATAGDSAGDVIDLCWSILSESILAFVCFFSLGVSLFICLYACILYICLHVMFVFR